MTPQEESSTVEERHVGGDHNITGHDSSLFREHYAGTTFPDVGYRSGLKYVAPIAIHGASQPLHISTRMDFCLASEANCPSHPERQGCFRDVGSGKSQALSNAGFLAHSVEAGGRVSEG